jgi:hypothetical protein
LRCEAIAKLQARLVWCGGLRALRLFSKVLTTLSVAAWLCSSGTADAKSKKKDDAAQKGKGKKGKAGKGSMDEGAGESDTGGLAPGSDDAKAKVPPAAPADSKKDAKASEKEAVPAEPDPVAETAPVATEEAAPPPAEPEPEPEPTTPRVRNNWITLGIQQEMLFFTPISGVCDAVDADGDEFPGHPQYSCRDANGIYDGDVYSGAGNEIQGGLGFATTRILIGFDRVFIDRLTVGGRVGYAFNGAPTVVGSGTFNPFHAELRSAFFFGQKPFERMGVRPYASLGVGIGEVDGKVSVDFFVDQEGYQQGERGQLDAWRKTGIAFGALGFGAGYPIGPLMPTLELRGLMMFGEPAFAVALAGNVAYGFSL